MIKVVIENKKPNDIMVIVNELRTQGLVQSKDFDFAYHRATYSTDGWECISPEYTVFSFHTEKYATLFALKYIS
jgi:hypothetical protein